MRSREPPKGFGDTEPICHAKCHPAAAEAPRRFTASRYLGPRCQPAETADCVPPQPQHPLPLVMATFPPRPLCPPNRVVTSPYVGVPMGPRYAAAPVLTCSVPVLLLLPREEKNIYLVVRPGQPRWGNQVGEPGGDQRGTSPTKPLVRPARPSALRRPWLKLPSDTGSGRAARAVPPAGRERDPPQPPVPSCQGRGRFWGRGARRDPASPVVASHPSLGPPSLAGETPIPHSRVPGEGRRCPLAPTPPQHPGSGSRWQGPPGRRRLWAGVLLEGHRPPAGLYLALQLFGTGSVSLGGGAISAASCCMGQAARAAAGIGAGGDGRGVPGPPSQPQAGDSTGIHVALSLEVGIVSLGSCPCRSHLPMGTPPTEPHCPGGWGSPKLGQGTGCWHPCGAAPTLLSPQLYHGAGCTLGCSAPRVGPKEGPRHLESDFSLRKCRILPAPGVGMSSAPTKRLCQLQLPPQLPAGAGKRGHSPDVPREGRSLWGAGKGPVSIPV